MALSPKEKKKIIDKVYAFISEGTSHCEGKHKRCEENNNYLAGLQWSDGDVYRQMIRERPAVPFNSIKKAVEAVANREITERFVPKVFGRSQEDGGIANVLDEASRWQRDIAETEHCASMAVRSMVTSGYGCMHKYWDPTANGGEGMIADEDIPIWQMLWPSRARQMNMADRRWHVCGKWIDMDEAEAIYGDVSRQAQAFFKKLPTSNALADTSVPLDSQMRRFGALSWGDVRNGQWITKANDEIFIVEAEWIETESFYRVAYPVKFDDFVAFMSGQTDQLDTGQQDEQGQPVTVDMNTFMSMDATQRKDMTEQILYESEIKAFDDRQQLMEFLNQYSQYVGEDFEDYRKVLRDVVKYAIVTKDIVWQSGDRPQGFTFEFLTGWPVETRNSNDFIGMVDVAKGPQDYKNALMSNMLAMYMSSPKTPVLIEEGALKDPNEFLDQFARPSGVVFVPDGFLQSQKFQQLQSPTFPPMSQQLLQMTSAAVEETFGLSSIDLNAQDDLRRVSGNVVQAAKTAGNTIVAVLFDAIRRFRRRFGLLNIKFIQIQYSPQQIIRIIGEDKAEDIPENPNWGDINRFDIKIDEEPVTANERIELIDKLTRTGDLGNWVAQGHMTFETMLELLPYIPESTKRKIREDSKTKEQMDQQVQQAQQQAQEAKQRLDLWFSLVKTLPQNQQIMNEYTALLNVATQSEEEKKQNEQDMQEAQGQGQQPQGQPPQGPPQGEQAPPPAGPPMGQ